MNQFKLENMDKIMLSPIPLEEFLEMIRVIVREEILNKNHEDMQEKLLAPKVACTVFEPKISLVTLNTWEKKGLLKKILIGGKSYYKYSEILEAGKVLKKYKR